MTGMPHEKTVKYAKISPKMCMLEENKVCDNCCECFICEIDSSKNCNNCADCVDVTRCGS